ncbi:MAG: serine hydrolase [SAR86 cluster bacterium]|uniref:Serine hydrolase n=1 Tax=SAR86 cluster bacterium TaxID=2030880 RepID=A0A2A4MKT7_9GAMM|nr:MAG: serine hydrolase [SAR86 cluster bacterium]
MFTRFLAICLPLALISLQFPVNAISSTLEDELTLVVDAFTEREPGVAIVVTQHGNILYSGATGMADLEFNIALNTFMPMEIASTTKQITAAAILILEEQGKLSVSDTLEKYFPGHASAEATIEQLMQNVAGVFVPGHTMGSNHIRSDISTEQRQQLIADGEPDFIPGERYAYSNSGYWLLGDIIAIVSGMTYEDFIHSHIFEPLGMTNSYFGAHRKIIPNRVKGYDYTDAGLKNASYTSETWAYSAGGLISSAQDIARWSNALFGGAVISNPNLERMTSRARLNNGDEVSYGYGLVLDVLEGYKTVEHGGGHSGFLVHTIRLIDEDVFVVVFANSFYMTNGYRPPQQKNPALIARRLALAVVED